MTTMTETLARDRRRLILEHLAAADGHALGEGVVAALVVEGRQATWRDQVLADVNYLVQLGLITVAEYPSALGPQREATLTGLGLDVARGRPHPAVADKLPGYL